MTLLASLLTWLDRADQDLFRAINGAFQDLGEGVFDQLLRFGNHYGNAVVALPILLAVWVLRKEGRVRASVELLLALLLVGVGNTALKRTFERPRPMVTLSAEFASGELGSGGGLLLESNSMPSGHEATCLAVVLVVGFWARSLPNRGRRRLAYVALAGAALHCGLARIHAGAHYPFDVLVGAVVGAACGLAALGASAACTVPGTLRHPFLRRLSDVGTSE